MAMINSGLLNYYILWLISKRIHINTPQKAANLICKLLGVCEKRVGCEFDKNEGEQSDKMSSHGHWDGEREW